VVVVMEPRVRAEPVIVAMVSLRGAGRAGGAAAASATATQRRLPDQRSRDSM
jgi:hypothetical protein